MVKIRSARNQKPSAAERERKMERERETLALLADI